MTLFYNGGPNHPFQNESLYLSENLHWQLLSCLQVCHESFSKVVNLQVCHESFSKVGNLQVCHESFSKLGNRQSKKKAEREKNALESHLPSICLHLIAPPPPHYNCSTRSTPKTPNVAMHYSICPSFLKPV